MLRSIFLLSLFIAQGSWAQIETTPEQDSLIAAIKQETQVDFQNMLDQLAIKEIRPGANGRDPDAANAANYDEAKANPFTDYPDPLLFHNGTPVTSASQWEQRRKEIMGSFDREVYGVMPSNVPSVHWKIVSQSAEKKEGFDIITKQLLGHADNPQDPDIPVDIEVSVTVPAKSMKPVPIIIQFSFTFPPWFPRRDRPGADQWQLNLLQAGWGYAEIKTTTIQEDNGAGLTKGIIGLTNHGARRTPEQWGSLRAWAWGASRVLDYLETDTNIDATKVGITGHSRFGKAALVTMAYDPRFAIGYISSSGEGGASLFRRNFGELVENVAGSGEYHWMVGNFIKYAGPLQWDDLPVDSHELIALCAPRPVFIGCGLDGDQWVDPKGMFMAAEMAGPVYELLGKKGMGTDQYPPLETELIAGDIGFRQHKEGHTPAPNWAVFIRFAQKYFEK